jgi:hypothetical protein
VLLSGLALIVAGLAWLTRVPVDASYAVDLLPAMVALGVGAGLAFPALSTLAMSGATAHDAGLASGLLNTTLQVGGAVGLAVLATLSSEETAGRIADGQSTASALTAGYTLAFTVAAMLLVVAIVVAATILRPAPREPEVVGEPVLVDG